jgi:hypothetical protein
VPDELDRLFQDIADGVKRIVIAVGARKDHHSKFHALIAPWRIFGKIHFSTSAGRSFGAANIEATKGFESSQKKLRNF